MNKSILLGFAIGAGVATAGGVIAGYQVFGRSAEQPAGSAVVTEEAHTMDHETLHGTTVQPAAVPNAAPSIERVAPRPAQIAPAAAPVRTAPAPTQAARTAPPPAPVVREECWDEEVEVAAAPRDDKRIAGTAVGALVGGAVAKDLGDRDLTTAVGAAAGAVIGRKIQGRIQENRATTTTVVERRCAPVGSR